MPKDCCRGASTTTAQRSSCYQDVRCHEESAYLLLPLLDQLPFDHLPSCCSPLIGDIDDHDTSSDNHISSSPRIPVAANSSSTTGYEAEAIEHNTVTTEERTDKGKSKCFDQQRKKRATCRLRIRNNFPSPPNHPAITRIPHQLLLPPPQWR